MKRTLLAILCFLLVALSQVGAQIAARVGSGKSQPSPNRIPLYHNHPLTPLFFETFDTVAPVSYDLGGWGTNDPVNPGSIDANYTANILHGTQSLQIISATDDPVYATNSFAAQDRVWVFFKLRLNSITDGANNRTIFRLLESGNACQFSLTLNDDGNEVRGFFACGGTSLNPITISSGVTYNVWLEYWNNNGANRFASYAISQSPVRPLSGNPEYVEGTTTTTATQVSRLMLGSAHDESPVSASVINYVIDYVLVDDVQIGDYP